MPFPTEVVQEANDYIKLTAYYSPWVSEAIHSVVALEIPERLKQEPRSIADLATQSKCDEKILYRILRMLSSIGIFKENAGRVFEHSPMSEYLRKDHPQSLAFIDFFYEEKFRRAWDETLTAIKKGRPAYEIVNEEQVYAHAEKDPPFVKKLNMYMRTRTLQIIASILEHYDFSNVRHLVDVGGGLGQVSVAILKKYPQLSATLFDLPEMIKDAKEKNAGQNNLSFAAGSFLEEIIPGGDIYLLKSIIHGWNDEEALKILTNCRNAMPDGAKLLIIDDIIANDGSTKRAIIEDVKMALLTGGEERTLADFQALLNKSGFCMNKFIPTPTTGIIEASKDN